MCVYDCFPNQIKQKNARDVGSFANAWDIDLLIRQKRYLK
jgi:hypothetical protein